MKRIKRSLLPATLVFLALMVPSFASASPGYTGYSGMSGKNCSACHSGGAAPTVTISGPSSATPGSVNSYTLKITGGPLTAGACDIAVSAGALSAGTGDTLKNSEVSGGPTSPSGSPSAVSFPFTWTAPSSAGSYTLYACGLSTNGNGSTSGDGVSTIKFTVTVAGSNSVSVPNVVGLTQAAATSAVTNAQLVVGTVTQQASSTVPAGSVISQSPAAGFSVAQSSSVDLIISAGSQTNNHSPVANAGLDLTVLPGSLNVLSGSYSSDSDGSIASYLWTQTGGPSVKLSDPTVPDPVFQAPTSPATLTFTLTVTDNGGLQSSDTVSVVVLAVDSGPGTAPTNQPPVADAGPDQTVSGGSKVTLSAAGSSDPEKSKVTYQWKQISGTTVKLSGANQVKATFVAPKSESGATLTFQLTVTDKGGLSSTATVTVTIKSSDGERD